MLRSAQHDRYGDSRAYWWAGGPCGTQQHPAQPAPTQVDSRPRFIPLWCVCTPSAGSAPEREDARVCSLKQRVAGTETDSRLVLGDGVREFVAIESRSRRHGQADEREVLYRWAFDEPWDEISGDMGVTTNALKKRFAYHLKKIRSRMLNANKPVSTK